MKYSTHDFYCMKCGNKGIPIQRKRCNFREKLHKKKLYCLTCGEEVNHVEITCPDDLTTFKENFVQGVYSNEVKEFNINGGTSWRR